MTLSQRLDLIAGGLARVSANVARLTDDAKALEAQRRPRGANVVEAFMLEESAKFFMLLDLIRTNISDGQSWSRQVKRFYDHLARCLYAAAYDGNPASLAEVRRHVDSLRRSHYLDGPNDFDWIFRNEPLARRENALYVDLIETEDGLEWWGPNDDELCYVSMRLPDLVSGIMATGIGSRRGLEVVYKIWSPVDVADKMHWAEAAGLNQRVLSQVFELDLAQAAATQANVNSVYNDWIFPLGGLDMTEIKVDVQTLKETRKAMSDHMLAEYLGIDYSDY